MADDLKSSGLWSDALRVGLGCMRLSTDPDRDEARSLETIRTALDCGVTIFDTAHAYALDDGELGHNERLLSKALRAAEAHADVRIITKGGMKRPGGAWRPAGKAKSLRADCEASLEALGGLPIDLYLLHAPDPATPWSTSIRALAALAEEKLVRHIGLSNVSRRQLDEALDLAPIFAVQIAISPFDDSAIRGGVVERCLERGIAILAYSPLGGPERIRRIRRLEPIATIARERGITPETVVLASVLAVDPHIIVLPGARRPETASRLADAARLTLIEAERSALGALYAPIYPPSAASASAEGEVVLIMGVQGSGKSESARRWVERGYLRLNRDERGGTLKALSAALEKALRDGQRRVVLDNTFLTRAMRQPFLQIAARLGVPVRGIWLETPLGETQVNVVLRMLRQHGRLLEPAELKKGDDPSRIHPRVVFRGARAVELPEGDEGFTWLERVPFERSEVAAGARPARFIAAELAFDERGALRSLPRSDVPTLIFGWNPQLSVDAQMQLAEVAKPLGPFVEVRFCRHPAGPPVCWCRPPLPGLLVEFAWRHGLELRLSTLIGWGAALPHLSEVIGARFERVSPSSTANG